MYLGTITYELVFVPRVPLSNNALPNQTHLLSTNNLAFTLSTALTTKSKPFQKLSLNNSSVSGATLFLKACTLN